MLSRYRKRISAFGVNPHEQYINMEKYQIHQFAEHSPNFKKVEIDDVPRNLLIVNTQQITAKTIYAMPDEDFDVGQIVFWNGSHWLITQRDLDNDIITRGYMQQCNRQITWQNPVSKKVFSLWATVEKPYYSNLSTTQKMEMSTREFRVQIPFTEESELIDIGKRFMMEIIGDEPKTYRVVSVDSMTQRYDRDGEIAGFIILNLEQDLYNPETDNKELEICDYVEPGAETTDVFSVAEISYYGSPVIRVGGSTKAFVGKFVNSDVIGIWKVSYDIGELTGITYSVEGNKLLLTAENDMRLAGKTIILEFSDESGKSKAEVEVEVTN